MGGEGEETCYLAEKVCHNELFFSRLVSEKSHHLEKKPHYSFKLFFKSCYLLVNKNT